MYKKQKKYIVKIVFENKSVGVAALGDPKIELSYIGKVVEQHILKINEIYNNISIDCYIIMPNHIHFIIYIKQRVAEGGDPYNIIYNKFSKRNNNKEI